jgi:hypothetical protein
MGDAELTWTAQPMIPSKVAVATTIWISNSFWILCAGIQMMMGKYNRMNKTNPISPVVVIPALNQGQSWLMHAWRSVTHLSGRVFFSRKNDGKIELRIMTKAWPPKYI